MLPRAHHTSPHFVGNAMQIIVQSVLIYILVWTKLFKSTMHLTFVEQAEFTDLVFCCVLCLVFCCVRCREGFGLDFGVLWGLL